MRHTLALLFAITFFCCRTSDNWGAEPEVRFNLLTLPASRAAADRLAGPAEVAYENVTLRASAGQLAELYQLSLWIDRRVDADRLISLTLRDATVSQCLAELARSSGAEAGLVENVVTIAPADRLAAMQYTAVRLHDQLSRAAGPAGTSARLQPLQWNLLTTPDELVARIAGNWSLQLKVDLPHDLMNAGRLQPCTVATQLTLVLGGFDLCAAGRSLGELRTIGLPAAAPWRAVYAATDFPAAHLVDPQALVADFPGAAATRSGSKVSVVGTTAAHLRLLSPDKTSTTSGPRAASGSMASRSGGPRPAGSARPGRAGAGGQAGGPPATQSDPLAGQRITFAKITDQPVAAVIAAMARQLGMEVTWAPSLSSTQKMALVTVEARGESVDAIFERLAAQAGLSIVREGLKVAIEPGAEGR